MITMEIITEYSYKLVDGDSKKVLESNSNFRDLNECLEEATSLLKVYIAEGV